MCIRDSYRICFKKFTKTEVKYCITRKELLAICTFLKQFRHYLLERRFKIRTDHKALTWLLNSENPSTSQYCRWIAEIEQYDFEIEHRKELNTQMLILWAGWKLVDNVSWSTKSQKRKAMSNFSISTQKNLQRMLLLRNITLYSLVNFLRDANFNWSGLNNDVVEFCKGIVLNEKIILGEPINHTQSLLTNLLKK